MVVLFFNEEANLESVLMELREVMDRIGEAFEVVAVNDGSRDRTGPVLDPMAADWPALHAIHQPSNLGQAAASWTGLQASRGQILVTLDGDGQNDPAALPDMLALLEKSGADMVVETRATRRDPQLRRLMSRVASRVRHFFLHDRVSDAGCALKVFRREVRTAFIPVRTLNSFPPALAVGGRLSRGGTARAAPASWWRSLQLRARSHALASAIGYARGLVVLSPHPSPDVADKCEPHPSLSSGRGWEI